MTFSEIINASNNSQSTGYHDYDYITLSQGLQLLTLIIISLSPLFICLCACKLNENLQRRRTGLHRLSQEP